MLRLGFDPAAGDVGNTKHDIGGPAVGMNLRPIDFEWVTMELVKIADICCNGRLVSPLPLCLPPSPFTPQVSVLEGGYGSYPLPSPAGVSKSSNKPEVFPPRHRLSKLTLFRNPKAAIWTAPSYRKPPVLTCGG
jgi:hypothetical protein